MASVIADVPDLTGKQIIVTGANSGIGFEAARVFASKHAEVVLACRSLERGHAAQRAILTQTPDARVAVAALDLASLASVRQFADHIRQTRSALHVLVNNAGVMAIPRRTTVDGFEMQFGVNHLGHFALTGLLLPLLLATPGARVVSVSSQASAIGRMHWDDLDGARSYHKWGAYGQSKLANLLFAFALAHRLEDKQLAMRSLACHPGYAATNLQLVGPELEGSRLSAAMMRLGNRLFARSALTGALPTLYAATSPDAQNGSYIGPSRFSNYGPPRALKAVKPAYDRVAQENLWQISIERTGVDYAALA